jgi:hypothetical protein
MVTTEAGEYRFEALPPSPLPPGTHPLPPLQVYARRSTAGMGGLSWSAPARHEEHQYLDLIREIMDHGVLRGDRTGPSSPATAPRVRSRSQSHGARHWDPFCVRSHDAVQPAQRGAPSPHNEAHFLARCRRGAPLVRRRYPPPPPCPHGPAALLTCDVAGETDARKLQEKNVRIWDGNSTREFLDSRGPLPAPPRQKTPLVEPHPWIGC